jgi:lipooligosaccharide transport system permease protein
MNATATTTTPSLLSWFAAPRISQRCWPVVQRNWLVWKKLAVPSLLGNIAEPLIILVAFGYGLGALVGRVNDLPYILFLASGSICMSTMYAASFEAMYSAFSRMQVQKTWESILNAPIALDDIVFAEMLWAGIKALITATAIAGVLVALGISRTPMLLLALPVLFLVGLTFAAIALVFNALAKGYDFFTYYFTLVLTPMTFLSGVYFPLEQMPGWLQRIAAVLPLSAAVELVRPLVIGVWPTQWLQPLAVLIAYAAIGYWIALALTRRRFFR